MRVSGVLRLLALIFAIVTTWMFIRSYMSFSMKTIRLPRWSLSSPEVKKYKCGLIKPCPANYFAFKICSGAANVVGPTMCFEDRMIMSPVKNNVGRGLNIALVNGTTGAVLGQKAFDMYSGGSGNLAPWESHHLMPLMNDESRKLFSDLGSSYAKQLGFRDSWVFIGAKDLRGKSPFEQFLKNSPDTNKYEGWPELLEMEGCMPPKPF
uniref:FAM3 metabolism regulating signaling molecule D n=1 Tax=Pan paniscus TaxID=9597 RepID=A0A2R9AUN6_PANPA